ncbi:MAG: class B sortase [Lachnospiraceae bacterium]|nr:class B sortase [Lachnospiraceae bacterium]
MQRGRVDKKKIVLAFTAIASMVVLAIVVSKVISYSYDMYRSEKRVEELIEKIGVASLILDTDEETGKPVAYRREDNDSHEETPALQKSVSLKYKELYEINNDLAGWISIEDTRVNLPVMQTVFDEEFYLHRNFDKEEDRAGLPFIDYRCDTNDRSTNFIIYGHNMKNGDMFHDLLKYEDREFFDDHRYIRFDTIYEEAIYEIVAVFRSKVMYMTDDSFKFYNFIEADEEDDLTDYLEKIKSMSLYEINPSEGLTDELITLSTCEYSEEDGRFVVVARRVGEQPVIGEVRDE